MKQRGAKIKTKFGVGLSRWDWRAHQIALIPEIGLIDRSHYYGYCRFAICLAWLAWGVYVEIWTVKTECEEEK